VRRLLLLALVLAGCGSIPQRDWSAVNATTPSSVVGTELTLRIDKVRTTLAANGVTINSSQLDCYVSAIMARYGVAGLDSVVQPASITPELLKAATVALNTCLKK
jgi:hypothetical protein